jgi:hypothetical protein
MEGMQGEGVDLAKLLRSAWVFHGTPWQGPTPLRHSRFSHIADKPTVCTIIDPWSRPCQFLLYIPPRPHKIVLRPRLIERLNERVRVSAGRTPGVTLISAPASFGKTTLLRDTRPTGLAMTSL